MNTTQTGGKASSLALAIQQAKAANPDSKQCWQAMRRIKWRMRATALGLYASEDKHGITTTPDATKATVFDARDNEEMKLRYFRAVTGIHWEAELV